MADTSISHSKLSITSSSPASVCPTERIRTPSAPLLTMEAIENAFHDDAHYITETEVVRAQTQLFRKKVQVRISEVLLQNYRNSSHSRS
ncbi:hypothetical protein KIN20_000351 [Parelaphostrongylus tenuis]|uniref:Uncharacterized protein n=1 Tax=Parelaphostrongylus tenuis TaxID=148309 RepID=A0AAD5QBF7_PARTN|nr:hypothetical protein KIN20_000351 [Parelaphostrongylus tenuis]